MARGDEQTNVRLPKDLKDWLAQQATQNHRSLTAEICHLLEECRQRQLAAQKKVKP
ncbi:Arc family DNA-binding protein [uncultured Hydrogenophaga sp.]|uniref:Arc family DNA-binding protein n=1 Tax=uncultured Hydrogenophaga sp. TaxID=199683 RepID=UPI0025894131|nr:Arc family DNA-binding protein [uncultured Hydrogenophaga sp.]